MVMEFGTGRVLHEQDADRRIPPASITKIMTMYLVYEDIEAGRLRMTDRSRSAPGPRPRADRACIGGPRDGHRGRTPRRHGRGLGHDACVAMAEHLAGSKHSCAG
jgi:D-alanyl-D-alanine carboxypeptidase